MPKEGTLIEPIPQWVFDREDELKAQLVTCPVCGLVGFEEDAGRICPHNGCYVHEAGGWK